MPKKKKLNWMMEEFLKNEAFVKRLRKVDPNTETFQVSFHPVPKPEENKDPKDWEPTTEDDFAKIIEWFSNQRHI